MLKFLLILSGLLTGGVSTATTIFKVAPFGGPVPGNQIAAEAADGATDDLKPFNWSLAYNRTKDSPSLFELTEFCEETLQKIIPDCQTLHPVPAWRIKELYDDTFYSLQSSFLEKLSVLKTEGFSIDQGAGETVSTEKVRPSRINSQALNPVNWKRSSVFSSLDFHPPTDDLQPFSWSSAYNFTKSSPNLSELTEFCKSAPKTRKSRRLCSALPPVLVWRIKEVEDTLRNGFPESLQNIDSAGLRLLANMDTYILSRSIRKARSSKATVIRNWLIENEWVVVALIDEDDDLFRIFDSLFDMSLWDGFNYPVSRQLNQFVQGILSLSEDKGNEAGLEWMFLFFDESCRGSEAESLCVFEKYCQLDLTRPQERKLLKNSSEFKDLLNEILEDYSPYTRPSWWNAEIEADNLLSWKSHKHNICAALSADFAEL